MPDSNGRYRQSTELGEDGVGGFGPDEWFGVIVVLPEVTVDCGLKVDDRSEDAAPNALAGEFGEEAFDGLEPGAGFRLEVEGPARVPGEPGFDFWVGVRGVVVDNGLDQLAGRNRALDGIEEADELLVPVSLHAAAEDDPIERVEGGKQGGRAVPLVEAMGPAPRACDLDAATQPEGGPCNSPMT